MAHLLNVEYDGLLRGALSAQRTQAGHVTETAEDGCAPASNALAV